MLVVMKTFFRNHWPIFFIVLLWFLFCSPFFLHGKIPFPGDYQVTFFPPWSQYGQFAQPVKNSAMPDVVDQLYPWKHLVISEWKSGQIPLWNPYNFAGTPLLANYQSSVFSPLNMLFFIFPFITAWSMLILMQPLLAGVGMYLFARRIGVSQIGASLSAVAFMFCGFMTTWMGYGTLGYAVGVLPLVLLGIEGFMQTKQFRFILLTICSLAFSFLSGHFQMSLYVLLAGVCYTIFCATHEKNRKKILIAFLVLLTGVLLAAPQIFPSIEFYAQSLRSTIFARPEVIPWQYLLASFAPDFFGNPVTRNDWFGHYAEWSSYVGILPLLFGLFSLQNFRINKYVRVFSMLGFLSLLLATPTFLGDLIVYLHIPVLATSAAGRIIVVFSFCFAVLAGIGFDLWIKSPKRILLGILSIIFLLLGWGIILGKIGLSLEHVVVAKQNFLLPSLFLGSALVGSVIAYFVKNKKVLIILSFTFLLLSSFDMYRFASKWQSFSPQNLVFPEVGVTSFFQKVHNERVLGNYGGQVSIFYQLPSLEGYDALYPERFGEFVSYVANGNLQPASRSTVDFPKTGRYTREAINLLGVTYIVQKLSDVGKPWAFPIEKYPTDDFTIAYKDSEYVVFKNTKALPRAFVAQSYVVTANKKDTVTKLFTKGIDQSKTLVLEQDPHISQSANLSAHAVITSYSYNNVTIAVQSNEKALLFLSDTYFPGWHAYIDGKETPILRADYTFRSIVIPAGKHTVIFSYFPTSFLFGCSAFIVGVILLGGIYFFQKRSVW